MTCVALLVAACLGFAPASAMNPSPSFYVESTGQILADPFLGFWIENDGNRMLGMPVSDVVDLGGRPAQYFQYGVLVAKANGSVSRIKAGSDLLDALRGDPTIIDGRRTPGPRTTQAAPQPDTPGQTNVSGLPPAPTVDAELVPYWQQWGGASLLGEPISLAYRHDGIRSQWFEFGRIDHSPTGASLAEVGLELARQSHAAMTPVEQGNLPIFDPTRFVDFAGDGAIANASGPFDPVRLRIPSIGVDAEIEITTVVDGVMTNPVDPWNAGWYESFSRPGEWTNTVIAGHRDWWGYGPVVFWKLGNVQSGDKIYLLGADSAGATHIVDSVQVVPRT
ncbi:MAG: class F sortase, partial [Thermomicrobiales bacterium]|nr:class F sortase [Thermomicrobiales bacterium]